MKVVVIGNGKIGSSLSSALVSEGHDVTIVDNNEAKLNRSKNTLDVMCIEGNGATSETQLEASVDKSQIVISVTPYDELNILSCLIAKRLGAEKTILRVRMPEYFKQMHLIKEELGLSMVINPELITASEIFRVLTLPAAVKVEVFGKGRLELIEFKVTDKTGIAPVNLQNLYKKVKTKFLVCAVQRDKEVLIPTGDFIIRNNDRLSIAATHKSIEKFFRSSGLMKDKVKSVMIAGGGMIGYYLASQLLAVGMRVKIIEKDEDRSLEIARLLPKAIVICGDGTDQALLLEEGIMSVDAFVALTGIDEENIILSLFAKENTNAKVVTKINRDNYINIASQIGIDCIVSPKSLVVSNVISYVRSLDNAADSEIESLYHLVGGEVEAIEFKVKENVENVVGIPLKDMKLKGNILISAIIRKREIIIPDGNTEIELGDSVVIVAKEHRFSKLKDILA
ncbi:MAG: Trk system potassium transporter TrkA [Oscillospiraceae bacterium]|nr:Trk system potassium transporter TrkA [Oscillospiraceae bacterium]MDY3258170.1 Trk system potassium transporter TrkA [Ruminococcus callidus]